MIEHIWTILCARCIVDSRTNSTTLFDLLEEIHVAVPITAPGVIPQMVELVTLWARTYEDTACRGRSRLSVRDPNGEVIGQPMQYDVDLTDRPRLRNITTFGGFPVNSVGRYTLTVELEQDGSWRTVASVYLSVLT
jgi:hypothetical protein